MGRASLEPPTDRPVVGGPRQRVTAQSGGQNGDVCAVVLRGGSLQKLAATY